VLRRHNSRPAYSLPGCHPLTAALSSNGLNDLTGILQVPQRSLTEEIATNTNYKLVAPKPHTGGRIRREALALQRLVITSLSSGQQRAYASAKKELDDLVKTIEAEHERHRKYSKEI